MQKVKALLFSISAVLFCVLASAQDSDRPLLAVNGPTLPPAIRSQAEAKLYREFNRLLLEVGFPDLSGEIAKTITSAEFAKLEQINKETLEANWRRLQIINDARNLATELLASLAPAIGNPNRSEMIADFTARLLSSKRLAIPDAFPDEIRAMKNWDQREHAKIAFLNGAIEKNIQRQREQILSDALHVIYGREKVESALASRVRDEKRKMLTDIRRLDILVGRYVRATYFDHEMGLGRWVGEAVAIGLVHNSRLSKDAEAKKFEALLNARAFAHGEYLSDAISDTMTFEKSDGKVERVKIKNGATIMEMYATDTISRASASGIRPGSIWERMKAARHGLLTPLTMVALAADEQKMMWTAIDGVELTLKQKMALNLANSPSAKKGASHAGMAVVYKNAESGVAVTRAIDQYAFGPTPWGSTRFITVKSIFSTPGVFASFSVATMRPKDLLEYLQNEIRKEGYKEVFKVSPIRRPDGPATLADSGEEFEWKVRISAEEQRRLLDVKSENAERWYNEDLAPRLTAEATRNITKYGMAFRTYGLDKPNKMACACTEMIDIVGFRETGFSLRSNRNEITWVARAADRLRPTLVRFIPLLKDAPALPTEEIISPSAWAWDTKTETKMVPYRLRSPVEAFEEQTSALRPDFDSELTRAISKFIDRRISYTPMQIGQATYQPREYLNRTEVTVVPAGKNPGASTFVPRVNPMGVSTSKATLVMHHYAPGDGLAADQTPKELAEARKNLTTLIESLSVPHKSAAAIWIMSELLPRIAEKGFVETVERLTAKLMNLKPLNPPRDVPHEIKMLSQGRREQALRLYITEFAGKQIESHTLQVLSDIAGTLYGKERVEQASKFPSGEGSAELRKKLSELYERIGADVQKMYLESTVADGRALGTTLAAILIDWSKKNRRPGVINRLKSNLLTFNLDLGEFFDVNYKARSNPGAFITSRLTRPRGTLKPSATEMAQVKFGSYYEAQPELTRSLERIFGGAGKFETLKFTKAENDYLFRRMIYEYMVPVNREQKGSSWSFGTSDMIRANPNPPIAPKLAPSCKMIFGG